MGTWCYTKFNTNDKDIANVIKDGLVAEVEINKDTFGTIDYAEYECG